MLSVKYFKVHEKRNVQDLGYSALCLGLSIMWFFQVFSNYFIAGTETLTLGIWNAVNLGTLTWDIGFIGIIIGGFLFIVVIERHVVFIRKYLFTVIHSVCTGIFILLFLWDPAIARMFASVTSVFIIVFWFMFIWDLAKKVRNKPGYKNVAFKFLGSVTLFTVGCTLTVDFGAGIPSIDSRLVGLCIMFGSFLWISILLLYFPPVALLEWKKSLKELFIISKAGLCLIQKSYGGRTRELDESLVTSALTTVNVLIQEMIANSERGFSKVKKENMIIFLFSSTLVNGAVISNEDNPAIPPKLRQIVIQFEEIYGGIVPHWNGDGSVFRPMQLIIEEILSD